MLLPFQAASLAQGKKAPVTHHHIPEGTFLSAADTDFCTPLEYFEAHWFLLFTADSNPGPIPLRLLSAYDSLSTASGFREVLFKSSSKKWVIGHQELRASGTSFSLCQEDSRPPRLQGFTF